MNAWLEMEHKLGSELLQQVETIFKREEARLTRFCDQSELMRLNQQAGNWVEVSQPLWHLIRLAERLKRETEGRFDYTLLRRLAQAGYDLDFSQVRKRGRRRESLDRESKIETDSGSVRFDGVNRKIRLGTGTRLDLGGIAKGYTAQTCCHLLNRIAPCLIDAGGDLVAGDAPLDWPGWPVSISGPRYREDAEPPEIGRLWLANETLATSGIDYRRWLLDGKMAHHIIDPRTGRSAHTDLLTVSVVDPRADRAEGWATATLVFGLQAGLERLEALSIPAVLIDLSNQIYVTEPMRKRIQLTHRLSN